MTDFFKRYGDYSVRMRFYDSDEWITLARLYQEFKEQYEADIKQTENRLDSKDVFIVDNSNKAASSLMVKLAKQARPGAIIFVTDAEFDVLKTGVIRIGLDNYDTPPSD